MRSWHRQLMAVSLSAALSIQGAAAAWEDGVYQDKAAGYGGDIILTVTVRNGKIESLTTENTGGEKSEYYQKAEQAMRDAIIYANGIEGVDTVSGATGTSESILEAMKGVLEQASYRGKEGVIPMSDKEPTVSIKDPSPTVKPQPTV